MKIVFCFCVKGEKVRILNYRDYQYNYVNNYKFLGKKFLKKIYLNVLVLSD